MTNKRVAILDTTAVESFYRLGRFTDLLQLFSRVRIPERVEREFIATERDKRFAFLLAMYQLHSIEKCTEYDLIQVKLLSADARIDEGEAEVISQYSTLTGSHSELVAVLDDGKARQAAERLQIRVKGTLALLARLDLLGQLNYYESVAQLREHGARFADRVVERARTNERMLFDSGAPPAP